jgi:hypothetical protein
MKFERNVLLIIFACLISCGSRKVKYLNQLRDNLETFDGLNATIVNRYRYLFVGKDSLLELEIYPHKKLHGNFSRLYDSSIYDFCNRYDINAISLKLNNNETSDAIIYFIWDNNIQYLYNSKGIPGNTGFENTRVWIVPINNHWQFLYEKPQW